MNRSRLRVAAFACVYLFWSGTYPAIRFLVRSVPPFLLSGMRYLAAGLVLLSLARLRGVAFPNRRQFLGGAALGLSFLVLCNGVATWGLQYIGAGKATLMTACIPLVAVAYGWAFQGRKVGKAEALCLAVGLAGVVVLVGPGGNTGAHWQWGLAAIAWVVVVWALAMSESGRFPQVEDGMMAAGVQMLCGGGVLLFLSAGAEHPFTFGYASLSWQSWAAWAYLVFLGACLGYVSFNWLIRNEAPQLVGTYAFVNPVLAVVLGWAFLGEPIGWNTFTAAVLIVGSVAGSLWISPPKEEASAY